MVRWNLVRWHLEGWHLVGLVRCLMKGVKDACISV